MRVSHKARIEVYPLAFGIGSAVQVAVVDGDLMMGKFNEDGMCVCVCVCV